MVDMTVQRHILQLGSTEQQAHAAGKSSLHLALPTIDIGGLKKSWLNNVGLLLVRIRVGAICSRLHGCICTSPITAQRVYRCS